MARRGERDGLLRGEVARRVARLGVAALLRRVRHPVRIGLVVALALAVGGVAAVGRQGEPQEATPSLAGRLLVATPKMPDGRFAHTVIYMIEHDAGGAFGLVVNRVMGRLPFAALLEGLEIEAEAPAEGEVAVHYGGPVALGRGFLLHSLDYRDAATQVVGQDIGMTMDTEVVHAIAHGEGPERWLFAFGYAGWGPGQLEGEMARGHWTSVAADPELVFGEDGVDTWRRALRRESIAL